MKSSASPLTVIPATLAKFYTTHPDFDVLSVNLLDAETVKSLGMDAPAVADRLSTLRKWQRLRRITPDAATALILYNNDIGSAQQLTAMSKTTFVKTYQSKFGKTGDGASMATLIYNKALLVKDQTMHMLANVHSVSAAPYFRGMAVNHVSDGVPTYFESLSNYQEIFGSLDFCSCSECRSIFGPAAYFVDLMRIIDKAVTVPNAGIPAALTLQARRPDLWEMELTCGNTTTMVPYLQIVNEVLENTVINILLQQHPKSNPVVWQVLANSVFPFNTPYNLPLNEVRGLLQQFGITLSSVIQAFDPQNKAPLGKSVETLNLSYERYKFVTTSSVTSASLSAAYGVTINDQDNGGLDHLKAMLAQTALDRSTFLSLLRQDLSSEERNGVIYTYIPSPSFGTKLVLIFYGNSVVGTYDSHYGKLQGTLNNNIITGTWSESSQDPPDNVGSFQFTLTADRSSFTGKWMKGYNSEWEQTAWNGQQTGTSQAMMLAHGLYINQGEPGNTFMDISTNETDPKNPYEQVTNLTHDTLDRIGRFARLAKSIGWDYSTLDWIMTSLGYTAINDQLMIDLAEIKQLAERLNISPVILSSCWFDIKTRGMSDDDNSVALFDTIFNVPALIRNGANLAYYHPETIISGANKNAVFNNPSYWDKSANWIVDHTLYTSQVQGTKLDVDADSLTYGKRILSGIQATNDELTAIASLFFPGATLISLGLSNLSILYRHVLLPGQLGIAVSDYLILLRLLNKQGNSLLNPASIKEIADAVIWMKEAGFNVYELDYILNGTTSLYVNTGYTTDSLVSYLKSFLLSVQPLLVTKITFVSNAITADVSEAFFNYFTDPTNNFVDSKGVILQQLTDAQKVKITQLTLPDGTVIAPTTDQLNDTQKKFNQLFTDQQQFMCSSLAGFFNCNPELTAVMISGIAGIQNINSVLELYMVDNGENGPNMQNFIFMFSQHLLMSRRLFLSPEELDNIYLYPVAYLGSSTAIFNFEPLLLSNLHNIWKMKQLVSDFQDTKNQFIHFLALASSNKIVPDDMKALCALTGWQPAQCIFVCDNLFGKDKMCQTVGQIYEVNNCFETGQQLGIDMYFLKSICDLQLLPAATADNWKTYSDRANALTGALRAYFGENMWSTIFQKYNGPLLEQQRDVLEAFCLWQLGIQYQDITTSRNLYEFLLIDVDMSGCSQVSYIRQALNSAQLYLQRCRLNLEQNVTISTDDIPESWWVWLLNYRIWEANREVFLYPENYLDPSLRKTKTKLFKQLENDLSQVEVNKGNVDQVYKKYLDAFSNLAKLQMVESCQYTVHDPNLGAADTLFLFAKTQTDPAKYYYISRQSGSIWSEWNEIGVTIPSPYITPVYAFNRLFIFWVELSSVQENDPSVGAAANAKCTITKASIKYSFIDFSGNWSPPQALISDQVINVSIAANLNIPFTSSGFYNLNDPYWHKVQVTPVSSGNFSDPVAGRLSGEKLIVDYGPLYAVNSGDAQLPTPNMTVVNNSDITSFEATVANAVFDINAAIGANVNGQVRFMESTVIDDMLNSSWLINQDEFIYPANDVFGPNTAPAFQAGFDPLSGALVLFSTPQNTISNNYTGGMHPGSLFAQSPSIATAQSFTSTAIGISSTDSANYFSYLKLSNTINADGTVTSNIKGYTEDLIETILQITDKRKCRYVLDILFQIYYGSPVLLATPQGAGIATLPVRNAPCSFLFFHPSGTFLIETTGIPEITDAMQISTAFGWVGKSSFINAGLAIDSAESIVIFNGLQVNAIKLIDVNGIVNITLAQNVTPDMIVGILQITLQQAQWVLNILISSGKTSLQYVTTTVDINLNYNNMQFTSTRLTTGAVQDLNKRLFAQGIDGVLQLSAQMAPVNVGHCFGDFNPGFQVASPEAFYDNQVAFSGPYGYYYWELFYYAPTLIAAQLKNNRQFNDAESWYQYIFNPTLPPFSVNADSFINRDITKTLSEQYFTALTTAGYILSGAITSTGNLATVPQIASVLGLNLSVDPNGINLRTAREMQNMLQNSYLANPLGRYWQFKPFRNHTIESLTEELQNPVQIKIYNDDPFDPDAIARLRIGAYEKNLVMQYIDNLLAWGDMEFTQYTWETITTATMLYVYAYDLLGPRPENLGPCVTQPTSSFADIQKHYAGGEIPQFLIDMESSAGSSINQNIGQSGIAYNDLDVYFCVPENDQFMAYWDKVEDRLYKIRHCLNINGQAQPLPLFDPPLNPMQLVKAAAASNGVLNAQSLFQPAVPYYRFLSVLSRAYTLTNAVIQLGNSLLSALEKNDAEGLSLLNSSQQVALLNMMTLMKQKEIEVQTDTINSLNESLQSAQNRQTYYTNLINTGLNINESVGLLLSAESIPPQVMSIGIRGISIGGYLAPNIFGFADGGMQFGDAINAGAQISDSVAAIINQSAAVLSTMAQYDRRKEEWNLQQQTAQFDILQITQQITGAQAQLVYNQQDLVVHLKSIEQAGNVDAFLRSKFTNQELYQWMIGRVSSLYYNTYQLAVTTALSAQTAYQYELDNSDTFISYSYWDSLRKGLLSGEGLLLSIQQMEDAYRNKNSRRLEIEKTISLRQLFPQEFLKFKWGHDAGNQGVLNFTLSERLFDFDFPGHYCRKIKTVSVSLPAVIGPYQNLNATLSQGSNSVLLKADSMNVSPVNYLIYNTSSNPGGTAPPTPPADVLRSNWMPNQQIAVSRGINDSGLFQLDFNDERYLPFEGTGAVSGWTFNLPPDTNRINFDSISDVIVKVQYTALDGGNVFAGKVKSLYTQSAYTQYQNLKAKCMDMNQTYANAWFRMFATPPVAGFQTITFKVTDDYLLTTLKNIRINSVMVQIEALNGAVVNGGKGNEFISLTIGTGTIQPIAITDNFGEIVPTGISGDASDTVWQFSFNINKTPTVLLNSDPVNKALDPEQFLNMALVVVYQADAF